MEDREFNYINVIPLVDVMLVLLTIVLTTSAFIATGAIPVELPKVSKQQAGSPRTMTIEIDKRGNVHLNAQPVSCGDLKRSLECMDRSTPVLIRADRSIGLQLFVDVLDVVKTLEFRNVSLQTEQKV